MFEVHAPIPLDDRNAIRARVYGGSLIATAMLNAYTPGLTPTPSGHKAHHARHFRAKAAHFHGYTASEFGQAV